MWYSGCASGKSVAVKEINNRVDEIRATALSVYAEQSAIRDFVSAEEVKGLLLGMASEQETLEWYCFLTTAIRLTGRCSVWTTLRSVKTSRQ